MATRPSLTPPLRAVTLDATGTLIGCPAMGEIYAEVLSRHGLAVSAADVRRLFPVVWKELDCRTPRGGDRFASFPGGARAFWSRLLERLCELLDAGAPSPFAAAELYQRFARADAWVVYPDVEPALERMRAMGLGLAVVSNFDQRLPEILAGLDLARHLDVVLPSAEIEIAKPNPAIFHRALERLGVEPRAALHVGDSRLEDVEGAQAAGMEAVLLERGRAASDRGATRDLLELVAAIERRRAPAAPAGRL